MELLVRIFLTLVGIAGAFFVITFTVYFFNPDMKLTAAIEPFMQKHYDRIKRDKHL